MGQLGKRVVIGSDHGGISLKCELLPVLRDAGFEVEDIGVSAEGLVFDAKRGSLTGAASVDYPDYARQLAQAVAEGRFDFGVLLCGSGIGMSIVANKVAGVRAALCHEPYSAKMARAHNDANVLCMGARVVGAELAKEVLLAFASGVFEGGRHQRRVDKIAALDATRAGKQ